jgi:predicted DsbA family dithiol-disulfide isomerase
VKEAESLGVSGTPTMFVNGQMIDGARPVEEFRALFDSALQQAGVPAPAHAAPAANLAPQPDGAPAQPAPAPR